VGEGVRAEEEVASAIRWFPLLDVDPELARGFPPTSWFVRAARSWLRCSGCPPAAGTRSKKPSAIPP
jgi:hypothetical protein